MRTWILGSGIKDLGGSGIWAVTSAVGWQGGGNLAVHWGIVASGCFATTVHLAHCQHPLFALHILPHRNYYFLLIFSNCRFCEHKLMGESNVHCLSWWDVCLHGLMSSREEKGGAYPIFLLPLSIIRKSSRNKSIYISLAHLMVQAEK